MEISKYMFFRYVEILKMKNKLWSIDQWINGQRTFH